MALRTTPLYKSSANKKGSRNNNSAAIMALDDLSDDEELGSLIYNSSRTAKLFRAKEQQEKSSLSSSAATTPPNTVERHTDGTDNAQRARSGGASRRQAANNNDNNDALTSSPSPIVRPSPKPRPKRTAAAIIAATTSSSQPTTRKQQKRTAAAAAATTILTTTNPSQTTNRKQQSSSHKQSSSDSRALPSTTIQYLESWTKSHIDHPYPTKKEKAQIMKDTGIEREQLKSWLNNNRARCWKTGLGFMGGGGGEGGGETAPQTTRHHASAGSGGGGGGESDSNSTHPHLIHRKKKDIKPRRYTLPPRRPRQSTHNRPLLKEATTENRRGGGGGESDSNITHPRLIHRKKKDIKPRFKVGEKVYAAWWPDEARKDVPSWYPGIVRSCKEVLMENNGDGVGVGRNNSQYGPVRLYNVEYDDGDKLNGVEDRYVFTKADYLLHMRNAASGSGGGGGSGIDNGGKGENVVNIQCWKGVKNVTDGESNDGWASSVGWYNAAMLDGREQSFSLLLDALRAYDASVICKKGRARTEPSDLNLPEELSDKDAWLKSWDNSSDEEDDDNDNGDDNTDDNNYDNNGDGATERPTVSVLKYIRNIMTTEKQQRNIAVGLRVKVRFDYSMWYGGVITKVVNRGCRVEMKFNDGSVEVADFPDVDIIVDDRGNGRHCADAGAFIPRRTSQIW